MVNIHKHHSSLWYTNTQLYIIFLKSIYFQYLTPTPLLSLQREIRKEGRKEGHLLSNTIYLWLFSFHKQHNHQKSCGNHSCQSHSVDICWWFWGNPVERASCTSPERWVPWLSSWKLLRGLSVGPKSMENRKREGE